jgi:hypothetical protein
MRNKFRTKRQEVIRFVGIVITTGFFFGVGLSAGIASFFTMMPYHDTPADVAYVVPDRYLSYEYPGAEGDCYDCE